MLTFSFLFASCSEEAVAPNTIENISGKELFKSIVFADGSLTVKVPCFTKNKCSPKPFKRAIN